MVVVKTHYSLEIFAVHQAEAIMYCSQQVIQEESFCDWLKNHETCESFPLKSFAAYGRSLLKVEWSSEQINNWRSERN